MAKRKKESGEEIGVKEVEKKEKSPTIFTIIGYLTFDKKPWDRLTDQEKKQFNPYMINRFLSMDLDLCYAVNEFQRLTLGKMEHKDIYNFYFHLIPNQRYYLKYVTGKKIASDEDIKILQNYFGISMREVEDYYNILMKDKQGQNFLKKIKHQFQYEK